MIRFFFYQWLAQLLKIFRPSFLVCLLKHWMLSGKDNRITMMCSTSWRNPWREYKHPMAPGWQLVLLVLLPRVPYLSPACSHLPLSHGSRFSRYSHPVVADFIIIVIIISVQIWWTDPKTEKDQARIEEKDEKEKKEEGRRPDKRKSAEAPSPGSWLAPDNL